MIAGVCLSVCRVPREREGPGSPKLVGRKRITREPI